MEGNVRRRLFWTSGELVTAGAAARAVRVGARSLSRRPPDPRSPRFGPRATRPTGRAEG
jgi:hypothetical protein